MRTSRAVVWVFLGMIGAGLAAPRGAFASSGKVQPEDQVSVPVPRSELSGSQGVEQISVSTPSIFMTERFGEAPHLLLGASSWIPKSLTADSHLSGAGSFSGLVVPQASLTYISPPIVRWERLAISATAGIGFGVVARSGTYVGDDAEPNQAVQESLYLVPLRVGAEADLAVRGPWSLYGGLAVLPSIGFTTRTVFDDGQSVVGVPLELSAGGASDLRWLSSSLRGIELKAGVVVTTSPFTTADFSGVGVQAAVGFPL